MKLIDYLTDIKKMGPETFRAEILKLSETAKQHLLNADLETIAKYKTDLLKYAAVVISIPGVKSKIEGFING